MSVVSSRCFACVMRTCSRYVEKFTPVSYTHLDVYKRQPHKVSLTEEGELFLQYANQILDLVNRSEEDVRERKEGLQLSLIHILQGDTTEEIEGLKKLLEPIRNIYYALGTEDWRCV